MDESSNIQAKPAVVVPVHKQQPSETEIVSLRQCGKILGSHDIFLVCPQGLKLDAYRDYLPTATELRVAPHWMESIRAYNRMMISPVLVDALHEYTHMLVHEPDAIVLRDELIYWCRKPYDYIGAPWFEGFADAAPDAPAIGVGNSGLSLHRLGALRRLVTSRQRWYPFRQITKDFIRGATGNKKRLQRGFTALGQAGQLRGAWELYDGNCDWFWSFVVSRIDSDYKIAPIEQALRFSWEALPKRCMDLNRNQLPFGFHAWSKYDPDFLLTFMIDVGIYVRGKQHFNTTALEAQDRPFL